MRISLQKIKNIFKDKNIVDISSLMKGSIDFDSLEEINIRHQQKQGMSKWTDPAFLKLLV